MRESRTYGSVRGRPVMGVPTAIDPGLRSGQALRRHDGDNGPACHRLIRSLSGVALFERDGVMRWTLGVLGVVPGLTMTTTTGTSLVRQTLPDEKISKKHPYK